MDFESQVPDDNSEDHSKVPFIPFPPLNKVHEINKMNCKLRMYSEQDQYSLGYTRFSGPATTTTTLDVTSGLTVLTFSNETANYIFGNRHGELKREKEVIDEGPAWWGDISHLDITQDLPDVEFKPKGIFCWQREDKSYGAQLVYADSRNDETLSKNFRCSEMAHECLFTDEYGRQLNLASDCLEPKRVRFELTCSYEDDHCTKKISGVWYFQPGLRRVNFVHSDLAVNTERGILEASNVCENTELEHMGFLQRLALPVSNGAYDIAVWNLYLDLG